MSIPLEELQLHPPSQPSHPLPGSSDLLEEPAVLCLPGPFCLWFYLSWEVFDSSLLCFCSPMAPDLDVPNSASDLLTLWPCLLLLWKKQNRPSVGAVAVRHLPSVLFLARLPQHQSFFLLYPLRSYFPLLLQCHQHLCSAWSSVLWFI